MKICFFLPGLNNGGAERIFLYLNEYFDKLGNATEILCATNKGILFKFTKQKNIKSLNSKFAILSFFRLKNYIDRNRPDVIVASLEIPIIMLGLYNKFFNKKNRTILIARIANIYVQPTSLRQKIIYKFMEKVINSFDLIICNSEETKKSLNIIKCKNIEAVKVIYNPVIDRTFDEIKKININTKKHPVVLTIGRFIEQKRIDHVIKVFAETRKILGKGHLVIVGDGIQKEDLKKLGKTLNISNHITFISYFNKIPELLRSVDCFVNTSKYEGFGNIFIESIAFCKNTLAYESRGGASELLKNTSAFLVPDGRRDLLKKKLVEILKNNFNNYNRDSTYIKNFKKDLIANHYYNEILKVYEKNSV